MKQRLYLETTILSYLAARPSRDVVQVARQQITWAWWDARHGEFELYLSQVVVREASAGDPVAARRRLDFVGAMPLLDVNEAAVEVAEALINQGLLPPKAADDALHLALAAVHGMDYLLTWNCRHLANAEIAGPVAELIQGKGHHAPIVCTPEELMGEQ